MSKKPAYLFVGVWDEKTPAEFPKMLFVFGDNLINRGEKGQSIIRKCPNAIGIPTKKYPSMCSNAFFNDNEFKFNTEKIDNAFKTLVERLDKYEGVIFPADGQQKYLTSLGIGLSQLPLRAPKTHEYLCNKIGQLVKSNS